MAHVTTEIIYDFDEQPDWRADVHPDRVVLRSTDAVASIIIYGRDAAARAAAMLRRLIDQIDPPDNQHEDLQLFVWKNVLCDYTAGMAVALAHDLDEAKALLRAEEPFAPYIPGEPDELDSTEPSVTTTAAAYTVHGGG